jgi:hypothetical protein
MMVTSAAQIWLTTRTPSAGQRRHVDFYMRVRTSTEGTGGSLDVPAGRDTALSQHDRYLQRIGSTLRC